MSPFLGIVVDRNPLPKAVDVYALIINDLVVNMILASYDDILAIKQSYDYLVDVTMNGDPAAGIGHMYNAGLDTFIAPPSPPIDYVENVHAEFNEAIALVQQMVIDVGSGGGNLSNQDISAAYNSSLNDNPDIDVPTKTLIETIHQYVVSGG